MHRLLSQTSRRTTSRLLDRCNGPACLIPSQLLSDPLVGGRQQSTAAAAAASSPPPNSIEVFVDGAAVHVQKGSTVLQACDAAGHDIPRFCYHPRLSIAGNCRMCLVEVEKSPKPVASCAMPAMPGMKIKTDTPMVKKAREGVMELLLLNHPLDCPICDQGGECDLQDQSMEFGSDRGRFFGMKRSVEDKDIGPLVKTVMTRCIHCTRCVRFAKEIAGVEDLGITGRGRDSEIGTYVSQVLSSELSGNVIDLCPVGALTSRPYAFVARPWELKATESVDVTDGVGANIRVDSRGTEVLRVLPRLNEEVNEEWISDKARFSYDGLKRQRLFAPMIRDPTTGQLAPASWPDALAAVADAIHSLPNGGADMAVVAGRLADAESVVSLRDFAHKLGCQDLRAEGGDWPSEGSISVKSDSLAEYSFGLEGDVRSSYLLNSSLAGIEDSDAILLVGTDPRSEAPLFNLRLRKAVLAGRTTGRKVRVANIGPELDLTFPTEHLGEGGSVLVAIAEGRHPFAAALAQAKRPAVVVGAGALRREDRDTVLAAVHTICERGGVVRDDWNGFNLLHLAAGRVAALDIGFLPGPDVAIARKQPKLVYLLGADDVPQSDIPADAFVIYQGHHGDSGAARANIVLPGTAYTEKEATYVNTEGRVQMTRAAVPSVGAARDDWKIIRALSEVAGVGLPYDSVDEVRRRLREIAPHLGRVDDVETPLWLNGQAIAHRFAGIALDTPFTKAVANFYMTDPISRASVTMAKATAARQKVDNKLS